MRGIVFDLDDTLYLEQDYVLSGFRTVASAAASALSASSEELFDYLRGLFERNVRHETFDLLLVEYPGVASAHGIEDLVRIYREHEPAIDLCPGAGELLDTLRRSGARCGVISDGPLESQKRKLEALQLLDQRIDQAILTDRWGHGYWKPHPRAFEELACEWRLAPSQLVYVGDNPHKDFLAPRKLGWHTIRLRFSGQQHFAAATPTADHAADVEVDGFSTLARELGECG